MLDQEACYRALQTRDARFDGRFFTAVRSTGVFCRPVCPAPTPKRENCLFLACAAAARELGFRPCLRCRPETSPGTPAWLGTSATVSRALRLIADGALDDASVSSLAERLGIGERHLRRLFLTHLGASPLAVAQTRRLLFAKQLIDQTALPMAQVAFSAGFSSIRRFNAAVREAWDTSPSRLRRRGVTRRDTSEITLRIAYRPPFDWTGLLAFLAPRATPGVERVAEGRYARTIAVGDAVGTVEVAPARGDAALLARVRLSRPAPLVVVAERLRRVFDCGAEPAVIAGHLSRDRRLRNLLRRSPGIRVPGAWDGFELAVRAILGQQVSVAAATRLAGRVVEAYGEPLATKGSEGALHHVFPTPEALADADPDTLGMPAARTGAIRALARAVAKGHLRLDGAEGLDGSLRRLQSLPGVGEWTAHYVAMRALAEPDAFPASDLGIRKALGRDGRPASVGEVRDRAEAWRPWRAYAALLLWSSLHETG